jgi:hypothetical protein
VSDRTQLAGRGTERAGFLGSGCLVIPGRSGYCGWSTRLGGLQSVAGRDDRDGSLASVRRTGGVGGAAGGQAADDVESAQVGRRRDIGYLASLAAMHPRGPGPAGLARRTIRAGRIRPTTPLSRSSCRLPLPGDPCQRPSLSWPRKKIGVVRTVTGPESDKRLLLGQSLR